jgi:nitroreductase
MVVDIKDSIVNRHSIHSFSDKKISPDVIIEILTLANLAPSAGNLQARDFIIVDDTAIKQKLSAAALHQDFITEAPILIVVCANINRISAYGHRGFELYCIQGSAAAIEHILLLAVEYGLGACWVGAFNEPAVATILKVPSHIRPTALLPIGYSKEKPTRTSRIDTKKLIHYNVW